VQAILERFLHWTFKASAARRAEAARLLARAYLRTDISGTAREQVEAAMTLLLDDNVAEVRLALAETLARSADAPPHIILALAADKPTIAALVAEHSPILLLSELVDLIGSRSEIVQAAVARREFVPRELSAALAEVGSAEACRALLANGGAQVPRFSLDRIIERHGGDPALRVLLLERTDLPPDARQRVLTLLTESLHELTVAKGWLSLPRADLVIREARQSATIAAAFEAPAEAMPALIECLHRDGELTPAFMIRAAASGQALLFEAALARLAGMPQMRVRSLIAAGRPGGIGALLQRAGLPAATLPLFVAAFRLMGRGDTEPGPAADSRRAGALAEAVVAVHGQPTDRELGEILAFLRRFATESRRAAARSYVREVRQAA